MSTYVVTVKDKDGKHRIIVLADDNKNAIFKATTAYIAVTALHGEFPRILDLTTGEGNSLLNDVGGEVTDVSYLD